MRELINKWLIALGFKEPPPPPKKLRKPRVRKPKTTAPAAAADTEPSVRDAA